jgi:hypothetical protein
VVTALLTGAVLGYANVSDHPDLIRFAEQDLQRARAAERIADAWYDVYLLVLINLIPDDVTVEHKRRSPARDDLSE